MTNDEFLNVETDFGGTKGRTRGVKEPLCSPSICPPLRLLLFKIYKVAISRCRSLTTALHPKFREVAELLAKMDRLVLRFRRDEPGTRFAAAWDAARIIRDLGGAASATPTPPA